MSSYYTQKHILPGIPSGLSHQAQIKSPIRQHTAITFSENAEKAETKGKTPTQQRQIHKSEPGPIIIPIAGE